jgi:hypothetical protein
MPPGDRPAPASGVGRHRARVPAVVAAMAAAVAVLTAPLGIAPAGAASPPIQSAAEVAALSSSGAPALKLTSQTPWVTQPPPGATPPTFDLHLQAGPGTPAAASLGVTVSVYSCLSSVSSFNQSVSSSGPSGSPISRTTAPLPWSSLPAVGDGVNLSLQVEDSSFSVGQITSAQPVIHLHAGGPNCGAGVYPVHLELVNTTTNTVVGSLTTHLIYVTGAAPKSLKVATVVPLSATQDPAPRPTPASLVADPYNALARPTASVLDTISSTVQTLALSGAPVTVPVPGQTVQALDADGHQPTVKTLSELSAQGRDQFTAAPYTPVNAAGLVDAGLSSELTTQLARGQAVLNIATIGHSSTSGTATWISNDALDDATVAQLAGANYRQLILPSSDVSSSPTIGSSAQSFSLGSNVTALAANTDLTARFNADPGDPVLAASQILAELAQIYFEVPNEPQPRVVVVVPPAGWQPNSTLLATLLSALASSQILQPVTVAGAFSAFAAPISCPTSSPCRLTPPSSTSPLPVTAIRSQRTRIAGLASAIAPATTLPIELGDLVLASEAVTLKPARQGAVLTNTGSAINAQTGQISLAGGATVTLAARNGQIPITIDKAATMNYPVTGVLTLTSDRLLFSNGLSKITLPERLTHPTNNFEISVQARTSGEFKLEISYQAPAGGLLLASGLVTVRSNAFSVVGVLLSVVAVAVLAAWWVRTGMRRRRLRRIEDTR